MFLQQTLTSEDYTFKALLFQCRRKLVILELGISGIQGFRDSGIKNFIFPIPKFPNPSILNLAIFNSPIPQSLNAQ